MRARRQSRRQGGIPRQPRGARRMPETLDFYKADPINTRKLRFQCTSNGTYNVSRANMLLLWCVGKVVNTTVTSCYAGIRLRSVTIYTAGFVDASHNTKLNYSNSSIIWLSENAPDVEYSITGNPDHPGCLRTHPPPGSLADFWTPYNGSTASNLFTLSLNENDIVEVSFEWVPANGVETFSDNTLTTVAVGSFYYLALDGHSSNKIAPVSNPTTN